MDIRWGIREVYNSLLKIKIYLVTKNNFYIRSGISYHYFTPGVSISQTVGVRQFETSGGGSYGSGTSQYSFGTSGGNSYGGGISQSSFGFSGGSQQGSFQQLGTIVKNYSVSLVYKEGKEKRD